MSVRISVVLTAHNATRTLGRCLDALRIQDSLAARALEVIVVDDRSTDDTSDIARRSGIPSLTLLRLNEYGDPSLTARQVALDTGIRQARGDAVLLLDADAKVAPDWSASLATPVLANTADVVAGGVAFDAATRGMVPRIIAALQTVDAAYYLLVCRLLNAVGMPSGILFGSAALNRAMYERVGGFDRIGHALTEDLAFARAVKANGGRIGFSPRARARVNGSPGIGDLVRRAVRTSAGGTSALAVLLGFWMLMLPLTAVVGGVAGGGWWLVFAARYAAGVCLTAVAVGTSGEWKRMAYALIYEPVSIVI
jgi:glycosyltransferase involved in cell wall biosynthesis